MDRPLCQNGLERTPEIAGEPGRRWTGPCTPTWGMRSRREWNGPHRPGPGHNTDQQDPSTPWVPATGVEVKGRQDTPRTLTGGIGWEGGLLPSKKKAGNRHPEPEARTNGGQGGTAP